MEVTLYTTHCPKCTVLEMKLSQKNIPYTQETSMEEMERLGILSVPMLKVNNKMLPFKRAVDWVNEQ